MFPDKVLADFKAFCANRDGRLEAFWNSCLAKMKRDDGNNEFGFHESGKNDSDATATLDHDETTSVCNFMED